MAKRTVIKPKAHILEDYLMTPIHNITVTVIGAGGTGSKVMTALARINQALIGLDKTPLDVTLYDDDIVTVHNIGRQMYSPMDVGCYKSDVIISRLNRFFGTTWQSENVKYSGTKHKSNIVISCVDNVKTRYEISENLKKYDSNLSHNKNYYWLDFGNGKDYGQVILGSKTIKQPKSSKFKTVDKLKSFSDIYPNEIDSDDDGPSCSLEESLKKQSLFINSTLVELGMNMLYELLTTYVIDYNAIYLNLKEVKVSKKLL